MSESESPVLQMKRHPLEYQPYADNTPGSIPRNIASMAKESYAMPSPAGDAHAHAHADEQAARWGGGGMRPAGGPSIPGRPDSARVPMAQRTGLGAVMSVGSGNGLFSR
jgi:hypothetical protein